MFCYNCGNQLKDGDRFCDKCGVPVTPAAEPKQTAEEPAAQQAASETAAPGSETTTFNGGSATDREPGYVPPRYTVQQPVEEESKLMGILALVCGIGSFIMGWVPILMFVPEILSIIFGIVGIVKKSGRGMAIAGMVLGIMAFLTTLLMSLLIFLMFLDGIPMLF